MGIPTHWSSKFTLNIFLISDKFTSTIIKMKYVFLLSLLVATILANPVPADDEMVEITADFEMPEITADVVDSTMEGSELRAENPKPAGGNKNAAGKPKPAGGNKPKPAVKSGEEE